MFLAELSEMWISVAEWLQYGVEWIGEKGGAILQYIFYIATTGGVLTGVGYFIKIGLPILKNLNNPVLKKIADLLESIKLLTEKVELQNEVIDILKADNKTLKEYIILSSEVNQKSLLISDEMRNKFGLISTALKESDNEKAKSIGEDIEKAIEDNEISVEESVEILENIPIVEETLGMSLNDIELEIRGKVNE